MYQTGPYWYFIGAMQVLAALLLLIPATATLGALLFLPIGLSVFLVTWGIGFGNTVFVTAGMLLATIYLICWDADRVWAAFATVWGRGKTKGIFEDMHVVERVGWLLGAVAGMCLVMTTRGYVPQALIPQFLFMGVAGAACVLLGWVLGWRRRVAA